MRTTKYVLFAALGLAAVIFLTSDTAKDVREDLESRAKKNAKKLKKKFGKLGSDTADKLTDLRDMVGEEIEGLSDDARERIGNILNESTRTAGKIKSNAAKQLS